MNLELVAPFCEAIRPPARELVDIWAAQNLKIDSDISEYYDPSASPYFIQPARDIFNNELREICVVAPPGSGKTALLEACIAYICAEDPGNTLVASNVDELLKAWLDTRLHPILKRCEPLKNLVPKDQTKQKKLLMLAHMWVAARPANESALQQISVRWEFGDEVWQWAKGLIEYFRKRLHDRWNGRTILFSQAGHKGAWTKRGEFLPSDWFAACEKGDLFEYFWACDACNERHPYTWEFIRYEGDENKDKIDWQKVEETVRLVCPACSQPHYDSPQTRRRLSTGAVWIKTRDGEDNKHRTYVVPAAANFRVSWYKLAQEFIAAIAAKELGNLVPLFQFFTQRLSRFWEESPHQKFERLKGGGYRTADFIKGEKIENEVRRGMFVDVQQTHFWAIVRAYNSAGGSKLLFRGRIETVESVVSIGDQYHVLRGDVLMDSRWGGLQMVFDWCLKFGFMPCMGSGQDSFAHLTVNNKKERRLWSPVQASASTAGRRVKYIQWASDPIKDILARLRSGQAGEWLVPDDIDELYQRQMNSEHKEASSDGRGSRWKKHQRDNHFWDCEAMAVFFSLYYRLMRVSIDIPEEVDSAST